MPWPITTHGADNTDDYIGQLHGSGELFAGVGSDSSNKEMADGRSDGWQDEAGEPDIAEHQVGVDDGFDWLVEVMEYDVGGRLFSSDSEDGAHGQWYFSMAHNESDTGSEASSTFESIDDDLENITDDLLFLSCQDLFNCSQPDDSAACEHINDLPWAFDDHPSI